MVAGDRCYNCREFGHMMAQCPRPRRPPGGCFKCFEVDHQYRTCPQRVVGAFGGNIQPEMDDQSQEEANLVHELAVLQMVSATFPIYKVERVNVMRAFYFILNLIRLAPLVS